MRTFLWCREELGVNCRSWVSSDHSHIVVRTPEEVPLEVPHLRRRPKCKSDVLYLSFWDLIREVPGDDRRPLFTANDAKKIVEFVSMRSGLFIVNCEAGISRSAGIVFALRTHYGGDAEEVRRKACPNDLVVDLLGKELFERE